METYIPYIAIAVVAAVAVVWASINASAANRAIAKNEADILLVEASQRRSNGITGADIAALKELTGMDAKLANAGLKFGAKEWSLLRLVSAAAAAFLVFALAMSEGGVTSLLPWMLALAAFVGTFFGFNVYLNMRMEKMRKLLERQLSAVELQIAENARAGLSVQNSIAACIAQTQEPLRPHLERLYAEISYSDITLADAFDNMAKRTASNDVKMLAAVIRVQQDTGSNLADAVSFLNETIERRMQMRQELESTLAQTKITKVIVGIAPWVVFAMLAWAPMLAVEGFIEFYTTNNLGIMVLIGCAFVEALLLALINKMSDMKLD